MRHVSRRISSSLQPLSRRASVWAVCSDSPASTGRPARVRRRMRERRSAGSGLRSIQPRAATCATWRLVTDMSTARSSASLPMRMSS